MFQNMHLHIVFKFFAMINCFRFRKDVILSHQSWYNESHRNKYFVSSNKPLWPKQDLFDYQIADNKINKDADNKNLECIFL